MKNFKENKTLEILFIFIIILIGTSLRFLPHLPNFIPIGALALFSGAYFSKKIAFFIPLTMLFISDIFIGYYDFKLMFIVYFSFFLYVILGFKLVKNKQWYMVGGATVLGSILFFLITNFAVWFFTPWYAKTFSGIIQCYLMALPFFRNTLMGDAFYVFVFFGAYELAKNWINRLERKLIIKKLKT